MRQRGAIPATLAMAIGLAGAALADCPTGDNLVTGIRTTSPLGETETFTRLADGTVEVTYLVAPGEGTRYRLVKGLYATEHEEVLDGSVDGDTAVIITYPMPLDALPDPAPGATWDVEVWVRGLGSPMRELHSYRMGEMTRFAIGDCGYDMFPVEARYGLPPDGYRDRYLMLPELGIALMDERGPLDGPADLTARYTRIEAIR